MKGPRALVAPLLGALLLPGCPAKRGTEATGEASRVRICRVEIHDRTAPADRIPGWSEAVLRSQVERRLATASAVSVVQPPCRGGHELQLEAGIAFRKPEEAQEERVMLASARASVSGDPEAVTLQASTVAPLPRSPTPERERVAVARVVDQVLDDILFQAALASASPEKLVQALTEKDVNRLAAVVEIVATRRTRAAVPALNALLKHPDDRISDRAIGALVAVGDRRAVKELTRLSEFRDTARMAKVLDAIGALGGEEAKDYLEFVASGHEDADIRNLAAEALERMSRKKP
jgi:hypothetical protein